MTQLELFRKTCAHEYTGKFLYSAGFIEETLRRFNERYPEGSEKSLHERFGIYNPEWVMPEPPPGREKPDFSCWYKDISIPENAFINGLGVLNVPGSAFHFTRYISPLRNVTSVEECKSFQFPDLTGWSEAHMRQKADEAHAQGRIVIGTIGHIYEDAWQIRGYEEFLMDLLAEPEIPVFILDKLHQNALIKSAAAARAGADMLFTGDDVATQRAMIFNADVWRKYIKPLWKSVYDTARAIKPDIEIWYHSDGNIAEIIPDLIDIGVTILNPVQPECMDIDWVKREFGKHLVLDGTIGTQTTMPFGTPEEVKQTVRDRKRALGYDGALKLGPTHVLEPEVPPENIMAFFEACAEDM